MKKLFAFLMAALMLLLCACPAVTPSGSSTTGTTGGNQPSGSTTGAGTGNQPEQPIERTYAQTYPYVDEDGAVHIRYQDTYTFDARINTITDVNITSTVCGTDTPDEQLVIVMADSQTVTAVGCGTATVKFRSGEQKLIVDPSPINMLFVSGQSNAEGAHASTPPVKTDDYGEYYMRSPETMAYYTYTYHGLDITAAESSMRTPASYVIKSLKWGDETRYSSYKNGPDSTTLSDPDASFWGVGFCGALAYEWVKQTGERVWVVNASHGGHPINNFMPIGSEGIGDAPEARYNDYEQAVAVYNLALQTLYNEVDAGHFVLNHMGYYWMQGESDSVSRDTYYIDAFKRMHAGFMEDVVYNHGGVEKKLEFAGMMAVRSCKDNAGNSLAEIYMTGPRLAQIEMGADKTLDNIWMATTAGDRMTGTDEDMVAYLLSMYGSEENFREIFGYDMPTKRNQMHPDIHYAIFGYNELGMDAARNSLMLIYEQIPENCYPLDYPALKENTAVKLITVDGYSELEVISIDIAMGFGYVIPQITPFYRGSMGVELVPETEGFRFENFRLYCDGEKKDEITFTVRLNGKDIARYTLPVTYATGLVGAENKYAIYGGDLAENPPREVITIDNKSTWSLGWLSYRTKLFTSFSVIDSDGWLHEEGETKWTATWHGGFQGYLMGLSSAQDETLGICYTVTEAGKLGFRIDSMTDGKADVRFAIFKNGELVWPSTANADDYNDISGWFLLADGTGEASATTAVYVSEQLASAAVDVVPGDEIVFAFEKTGATPQKQIFPAVYYVTD